MRYFMAMIVVGLCLYALPHLYVLRKILRTFRTSMAAGLSLVAVFSLLTLAPIIVRALAISGHAAAPVMNLVVFSWLALLFWMTVYGVLLDAWNLGAWWVRRRHPGTRWRPVPPGRQMALMVALTALSATWAAIEARQLRVRRHVRVVPALEAGRRPVRVVFFSDLHLSAVSSRGLMDRVARTIEALKPDLILTGGDLIDAPAELLQAEARRLRDLQAPLGAFGVLGNHEWYIGLDEARAFHEAAGIRLLRGTAVEPVRGVYVGGVDDPTGRNLGARVHLDEQDLFPSDTGAPGALRLLLKHRPVRVAPAAPGRRLQLSGHTHGGQIFPFHLIVRLTNPQVWGIRTYAPEDEVWVSHGAGLWGPPFRMLAVPEIHLIELVPPDRL